MLGLMVMGEYEWLEGRLDPALVFRREHPKTPLAVLAEPGRGHFDWSDGLVNFLALFLRKAAGARLPTKTLLDHPPVLRTVDPDQGWLIESWRLDQPRKLPTAPVKDYTGDPAQAFWSFQQQETKTVRLTASSDAGVPVSYCVREGPAEIVVDTLRLTEIPPCSRFPVKVTVIAWQWGRGADPRLKAAAPVERTFSIMK